MCESGDTIIFLCSARERKNCIHTIKFFASFKSKSMLLLDVRACVRACGLWLRFDLWLAKYSQFRSQWIYISNANEIPHSFPNADKSTRTQQQQRSPAYFLDLYFLFCELYK